MVSEKGMVCILPCPATGEHLHMFIFLCISFSLAWALHQKVEIVLLSPVFNSLSHLSLAALFTSSFSISFVFTFHLFIFGCLQGAESGCGHDSGVLPLAQVDPDKAFAVQIQHDESVVTGPVAYVQCALLYTSSNGERRIRRAISHLT